MRVLPLLTLAIAFSTTGCDKPKAEHSEPEAKQPKSEAERPEAEKPEPDVPPAGKREFVLLPGQTIPTVPHTRPIRSGTPIYIGATELRFNERKLASLKDGVFGTEDVRSHLVLPLNDALLEAVDKERATAEKLGEEWPARASLIVDEKVKVETLIDVMYTCGRAEFNEYDFIVRDGGSNDDASIPISPPKFMGLGTPPPTLKVFIMADQFRVFPPGQVEPKSLPKLKAAGTSLDAWDTKALVDLAKELRTDDPELHSVTLSSENGIDFSVVAGTYSLLLGSKYDHLVIEAGAG